MSVNNSTNNTPNNTTGVGGSNNVGGTKSNTTSNANRSTMGVPAPGSGTPKQKTNRFVPSTTDMSKNSNFKGNRKDPTTSLTNLQFSKGMQDIRDDPMNAGRATGGADRLSQSISKFYKDTNPLMQRAEQRGLEMAANRGITNSSIAVGAAQGQVLDRADKLGTQAWKADDANYNKNLEMSRALTTDEWKANYQNVQAQQQQTRIDETLRSNQAQQELTKSQQAETSRANQAQEDLTRSQQAETHRANVAEEQRLQQVADESIAKSQQERDKIKADIEAMFVNLPGGGRISHQQHDIAMRSLDNTYATHAQMVTSIETNKDMSADAKKKGVWEANRIKNTRVASTLRRNGMMGANSTTARDFVGRNPPPQGWGATPQQFMAHMSMFGINNKKSAHDSIEAMFNNGNISASQYNALIDHANKNLQV